MAGKTSGLYEFTIDGGAAATRLDLFLAAQEELDLSRAQAQKLIQNGAVAINGKEPAKAGQKLKEGDRVQVLLPEPRVYQVRAEAIPLSIVYEDAELLVVDKPAGMVVHPAPGHYSGTLVNALLHHCGDLAGIGGVLRPGIVHRLDKDTSGLLVVAKTEKTHRNLVAQMKSRKVNRTYLALAKGNIAIPAGIIDAPIGRHPIDRKKMAVTGNGKEAVTHFRVLERFPGYTFLEIKLHTGRTHQIRVHLAYIGYPVVGDPVYGRGKDSLGLERQALHAARLCFTHPATGHEMTFTSPLPADIEGALNKLRVGV
ncbi:MAG: RluA family pseudouridine synthase [bacterium]|jgi:23S rRNA pseudouridine1911/1915/1917 synthase